MITSILITDIDWVYLKRQIEEDRHTLSALGITYIQGCKRVYLDFHDQKKLTFFLLKYSDGLSELKVINNYIT